MPRRSTRARAGAAAATAATVLLAAAPLGARAGLSLDVTAQGEYALSFDGDYSWKTALQGGGVGVRSNGKYQSSAAGSLALTSGPSPLSGSDEFGAYTGQSLTWGGGLMTTNFYVYSAPSFGAPGTSAVVFEQVFPGGLAGCSNGNNGDVATAFPVLGPPRAQLDTPLAYLTYVGMNILPHVAPYNAEGFNPGYFGAGWANELIVLFNSSLAAVALSPLGDWHTAYVSAPGATQQALTVGFNGELASLPPGYRQRSLLVAGAGVNDTVHAWGEALLLAGGKKRTGPADDWTTAHLSYWMDNGARRGMGAWELREAAAVRGRPPTDGAPRRDQLLPALPPLLPPPRDPARRRVLLVYHRARQELPADGAGRGRVPEEHQPARAEPAV
jgi:hypothetical protein